MSKYEEQVKKKLLGRPQLREGWEEELIHKTVAQPQHRLLSIMRLLVSCVNLFYRQRLLMPALVCGGLLILAFWNPLGSYLPPQSNSYNEALSYIEDITGVEDTLREEDILKEMEVINAWLPWSD